MLRARSFAHAFVTALALVSWGGVAWVVFDNPGTDSPIRLGGMALMALAATTTGIALLPVVVSSYVTRHKSLRDLRWVYETAYRHGRADEARAQVAQRRHLRVVGD